MGVAAGFLLIGAAIVGMLIIGQHGVSSAQAAQTAANNVGQGTSGAANAGQGLPAVHQAVQSVASSKGWGPGEVASWLGVIAKEDASGSLTATNPSSGAYGIAQGITGPSWYAAHGGSAGTIIGQVTAMGNYIEQRYGTPTAALAHENAFGWY